METLLSIVNTNTLLVCGLVLALLSGSGLFYFITKKTGKSFIDVALMIVTAIKTAIENSDIKSNRANTILDLIIQSLSYIQVTTDENVPISGKVIKAIDYMRVISKQLNIQISNDEYFIISEILALGFTIMNTLGATTKLSYTKLYIKMASYAKTPESVKNVGLRYLRGE